MARRSPALRLTLAATLLGHLFWLHHDGVFRYDLTTSLEHLAVPSGFLVIAVLDQNSVR
jgi:hypothetical protein